MTFRSVIVVAMFLAGCASPRPPGSSKTYDRDLYECTRQATFADVNIQQQVFDNCMRAKGYKEKSSSK
ncbi:MAG TPA: hypothetical protein VEG60_07165 [Candidatus Binatia bacterium]|nr:hypothetical protein [Candidatus Binatia bacterium]